MATTFQTGFEDYADGDSTSIAHGSLHDNGWFLSHDPALGYDIATVVSTVAHSGSKSVAIGTKLAPADPGAVVRATAINRTITASLSGRCAQIEAWGLHQDFNWEDDPFYNPRLVVSLYGYTAPSVGSGIYGGISPTNPAVFQVSTDHDILATAAITAPADWHKVRLEGVLSTLNESGTAFNNDGRIRGFFNDTLVIDVTDLVLSIGTPSDGFIAFSGAYCFIEGYVDDVLISNDETTAEIPPNDTNPCCGDRIDPTGIDGTPGPTPLQPWTRRCAGGGDVPTASDLVDDEVWAL